MKRGRLVGLMVVSLLFGVVVAAILFQHITARVVRILPHSLLHLRLLMLLLLLLGLVAVTHKFTFSGKL